MKVDESQSQNSVPWSALIRAGAAGEHWGHQVRNAYVIAVGEFVVQRFGGPFNFSAPKESPPSSLDSSGLSHSPLLHRKL